MLTAREICWEGLSQHTNRVNIAFHCLEQSAGFLLTNNNGPVTSHALSGLRLVFLEIYFS